MRVQVVDTQTAVNPAIFTLRERRQTNKRLSYFRANSASFLSIQLTMDGATDFGTWELFCS